METEGVDYYEALQISKDASKDEIRKAYRKLALLHHPDKVAESERETADIEFKKISRAYEILYDDEKRELYDQYGSAAFESGNRMPNGPTDVDDLLAQMFGMGGGMGGMGGMPGMGGPGGRPVPSRARKGQDDVQEYEISLEDLYKGKTVRFASTKKVVCGHCKGRGGKEGAKPKQCSSCGGQGVKSALRQQGAFLTEALIECDNCQGSGKVFSDKDKCKKCKGKRTVSEKKPLELYIPPGSLDGDRLRLHGEADQSPDQEPGDIVFVVTEKEHPTFERSGSNLKASITVTLAEALCGLSRIVIKTLDGRGLHITHQKPNGGVLKPGQVLRVHGEGMPIKKSDAKGDLFLVIDVEFPDDRLLQDIKVTSTLGEILPKFNAPIQANISDEIEYDASARLEDFISAEAEDGEWEYDNDEEQTAAQCAQQ